MATLLWSQYAGDLHSGVDLFDGMLLSCYFHAMSNLQVKNVPESLHQRLRCHVQAHHRTLSDFVLEAIECELARSEWRTHLAQRPRTDLGVSAASLLEQERRQRDELSG